MTWAETAARIELTMQAQDVVEELDWCRPQLQRALQTGDPKVIGSVVLAVRRAYAERLADRELFYPDHMPAPRITTEEAAELALVGVDAGTYYVEEA